MYYRNIVPSVSKYPYKAVEEGLLNAGLRRFEGSFVSKYAPIVCVTWSPWSKSLRELIAEKCRVVIVLENGWFSPIEGQKYYQVGLWGWNGSGTYPIFQFDDVDRGFKMARNFVQSSSRNPDGPVLVVGQKGGSQDIRCMPVDWPLAAMETLKSLGYEVRYRPKPAEGERILPPQEDLEGCQGVVTWNSTFASQALALGFPVAFCGPSVFFWEFCTRWDEKSTIRWKPVQTPLLRRYVISHSMSQWTDEEIASGAPFRRLLSLM